MLRTLAKALKPRFSLRCALLAMSLACVALGWRHLCWEQVRLAQDAADANDHARVLTMLNLENFDDVQSEVTINGLKSVQVAIPTSLWYREAVSWGLRPVELMFVAKPLEVGKKPDGQSVFRRVCLVYKANFRPWGFSKVRHDSTTVFGPPRPT